MAVFRRTRTSVEDFNGDCDVESQVSKSAKGRERPASLETILGMKVRIRDRKGKGKITIEYGTLEEFDRVVRMLKGKVAGSA